MIIFSICLNEIIWNINYLLQTSSHFFVIFVNSAHRDIIGVHLVTIPDVVNHFLFFGYAVHRYAIIANSPGFSQHFKSIRGITSFWLFSLVFACATSASRTMYMVAKYQLQWLTFSFEALKLLSQVGSLAIHAWASISLSKTLGQSEKFLSSLAPTESIKRRLVALKKINRFSLTFFVIHLSTSFTGNIRDIIEGSFRSNPLDNVSPALVSFLNFCSVLSFAGRMFSSISFVLAHFVYTKSYRLCKSSEE